MGEFEGERSDAGTILRPKWLNKENIDMNITDTKYQGEKNDIFKRVNKK
jgi:hypothetical protein